MDKVEAYIVSGCDDEDEDCYHVMVLSQSGMTGAINAAKAAYPEYEVFAVTKSELEILYAI